jgi:hypothetical protein
VLWRHLGEGLGYGMQVEGPGGPTQKNMLFIACCCCVCPVCLIVATTWRLLSILCLVHRRLAEKRKTEGADPSAAKRSRLTPNRDDSATEVTPPPLTPAYTPGGGGSGAWAAAGGAAGPSKEQLRKCQELLAKLAEDGQSHALKVGRRRCKLIGNDRRGCRESVTMRHGAGWVVHAQHAISRSHQVALLGCDCCRTSHGRAFSEVVLLSNAHVLLLKSTCCDLATPAGDSGAAGTCRVG